MPFSVPGDFAETAFSCNQKFMSYTRYILAMVPGLGLAFIMSQFLRSLPAVIAPDLRAELDLTAGQLSNLPAALFPHLLLSWILTKKLRMSRGPKVLTF